MLRAGDRVRVRRKPPLQLFGRRFNWVPTMGACCGQTYTVTHVYPETNSCMLDCGYGFQFDWLELGDLVAPVALFAIVVGQQANPDAVPEIHLGRAAADARALELGGSVVELAKLVGEPPDLPF